MLIFKTKIWAALLMAVVLVGCNDGSYQVRGDSVYYTWWTWSFGNQEEKLVGADAASFEELADWLGRDKNHVYYKSRLVDGADPATVKVRKKNLFCDRRDYYYEGAPLHVMDIGSFEVVQLNDYCLYAKDNKCGYFDSTRIEGIDPPTFKATGTFVARDKNHVYRFGKVVPQADPETYEELDGCYNKDKAKVWYQDSIMPDAVASSFNSKWDYGWDATRVWYNGKQLSGADAKTFQVLKSGYYAKDVKTVWYHDEIVKGADAASFKDDGDMIGHDKNQKYVCERIYDLDE